MKQGDLIITAEKYPIYRWELDSGTGPSYRFEAWTGLRDKLLFTDQKRPILSGKWQKPKTMTCMN